MPARRPNEKMPQVVLPSGSFLALGLSLSAQTVRCFENLHKFVEAFVLRGLNDHTIKETGRAASAKGPQGSSAACGAPEFKESPAVPSNLPDRISETELRTPQPSIVTVARVVYILHGVSILIGVATGASIIGAFLFGWPSIAAVVLNYVMRSDARGTYVESHFSWQIRTFWYAMFFALIVAGIGLVLSWLLVGIAVWMVGFVVMGIWVGYRIIRGWIRLSNGQTMPV